MGREVGASTSNTGHVMRRSVGPPPREPTGGRIRVLDSLLGQVAIAQVGKVLNKGVADLRNVDRILEERIAKLRERKVELMLEREKDEDPRDRIEEILADHANVSGSIEWTFFIALLNYFGNGPLDQRNKSLVLEDHE
jgi:hypothetical protein